MRKKNSWKIVLLSHAVWIVSTHWTFFMGSSITKVGLPPIKGDFLKDLSSIPLDDSRTTFLEKPLVNSSTTFFLYLTKSNDITFLLGRFHINLYLIYMCLFIFLFVWDGFTKSIITLLSQSTNITCRYLIKGYPIVSL